MENADGAFDIKTYERKVSMIGDETHITNITESEADQIIEYAKTRGIEATKDTLSDEEATRMNISKKTTVCLGHTIVSARALFDSRK